MFVKSIHYKTEKYIRDTWPGRRSYVNDMILHVHDTENGTVLISQEQKKQLILKYNNSSPAAV